MLKIRNAVKLNELVWLYIFEWGLSIYTYIESNRNHSNRVLFSERSRDKIRDNTSRQRSRMRWLFQEIKLNGQQLHSVLDCQNLEFTLHRFQIKSTWYSLCWFGNKKFVSTLKKLDENKEFFLFYGYVCLFLAQRNAHLNLTAWHIFTSLWSSRYQFETVIFDFAD